MGLQIQLADGWHTYWKNPGDAGLPVRLKWTLPEGFSAGPIQWPAPARIPAPPLMSYGYGGEVLLPVEITPPAELGAKQVTLAVKAEWLECRESCLPAKADLDLVLPVQAAEPKPGAAAPAVRRGATASPRATRRLVSVGRGGTARRGPDLPCAFRARRPPRPTSFRTSRGWPSTPRPRASSLSATATASR